jgi:hypothetical protein
MKEYLRIRAPLPWLFLLLATSACMMPVEQGKVADAEFTDLYLSRLDHSRAKGKGKLIITSEPFESVWDASVDVINDFSLPIMGIDDESKYILTTRKGTTYPLAVFLENTEGSDYTVIETVASRKPLGFRSKWESQLLRNIEKKLEDPSWHAKWQHDSRFYIKPDLTVHSPGGDIPLYMQLPSGEEITISADDGGIVALMAGYDFNSDWSGELGYGFQNFGMDNDSWDDCGSSNPGVREGRFETDLISAAIKYHFWDKTHMRASYILAGVNYYISPELSRCSDTINTTVNYDDTFGYRVGAGIIAHPGSAFFIFLDWNHVFGVKFQFEEMVENGVKSYSTYPEWTELDGNGSYLALGFGYHF